jgi:hypothetical protein
LFARSELELRSALRARTDAADAAVEFARSEFVLIGGGRQAAVARAATTPR